MILGTVRGKIIANSAWILLVLSLATLYTGFASSELARSVELLFRNNRKMDEVRSLLANTEMGLAGYLTTKSSDSLKDYIRFSTKLADEARKLSREIRQDESLLLQRDLGGVIDDYLEDAEASVTAKRGRDVAAYNLRYEDSERTAALARYLIDKVDAIFLSDSLVAYSGFSSQVSAVILSNALLVVAANLMGLMLLVRYSYTLTGPISRLAEAAKAVGRGEYDNELPIPVTMDEIGTTTTDFTSMQRSVRRAFEEIRSKSEVERRLMEERMRVLELDHRLKDAELLALQTQINPHFLFNTLSAGMQLALAEDADRTADFLENLAAFIRYVLKSPERSVRVADEIECVERYIWLLRLRFGERYRFHVSVDEAALHIETPALLLQPLVENAVAHGLRDREEGGEVRVSVSLEDSVAVLSVEDSGEGMGAEDMARIMREGSGDLSGRSDPSDRPDLSARSDQAPHPDQAGRNGGSAFSRSLHEGGIGLPNVIRRVSLATGGRGWVEIDSEPGKGTKVRIYIPAGSGS
jgi:two-component system, sensor histidine kinase YesM